MGSHNYTHTMAGVHYSLLLAPIMVSSIPVDPPTYPDIPPKYSYNYAVADDYSKANFLAEEDRDGYNTLGRYRVALPDGRVQTVTYTASEDGFVAEVAYEGEAVYPEKKTSYRQNPDSYKAQTE